MSVDTQRDKQQCAEVKRTTGIIPLSLSRHEYISGSTSFWGPTPQNTIARTCNWVRNRPAPPDRSVGHVSRHLEGQATVCRSETNAREQPLKSRVHEYICGSCAGVCCGSVVVGLGRRCRPVWRIFPPVPRRPRRAEPWAPTCLRRRQIHTSGPWSSQSHEVIVREASWNVVCHLNLF